MLKEYALEPSLLSNWKDFRYFSEKFGAPKGRLISRYPKNWKALVYKSLAGCSDLDRLRIVEKLASIDDKLLPRLNEWSKDHDWLENTIHEHSERPFHAIVAEDNPDGLESVLLAETLDDQEPLWRTQTHSSVPRTPSELAQAVAPLLAASSELIFIDPHFAPEKLRFALTLQNFLRTALINRSKPISTIEYHLKYNNSTMDFFEAACRRYVLSGVPSNLSLVFRRWQQIPGRENFHARYILTERGGVKIENGLDMGRPGETTPIDLMSEVEHEIVQRNFRSESPAFELVDEVILDGEAQAQ